MGAVYSVELNLKYSSAQDVVDATHRFINDFGPSAVFDGTDFTDLQGALECIFTKRGLQISELTDTSAVCSSDFDASYGWESVMTDWFNYVAPVLQNGSEFKIWPDNGYYSGTVQNGKVDWGELEEDDEDWDEDNWDEDTDDSGNAMKVDDPVLQQAIDLINDYILGEFDHVGIEAGDDLSDIGLMYTTDGDNDEVELQVSANLNDCTINYYVNGDLRHTDSYGSIQNMIDSELKDWGWGTFDALYSECLTYTTDEDYEI